MIRLTPPTIAAIVAAAAGCGDLPPTAQHDLSTTADPIEVARQKLTIVREQHTARTVTDPRFGRAVSLVVWRCRSTEEVAHPTVPCDVDPEYVLVGGSAHTNTASPGAMLTASYPNAGLTTWTASSKDHEAPHPHILYTFAHGIKVKDMSAQELRGYLTLTVRTSEKASHPYLPASDVPSNKWLLSVGAKVDYGNGPGSMLTALWPTEVAAKDHGWSSPATITAYEIMIPKSLPVANVEVKTADTTSALVERGVAYSGGTRVLDGYVEVGAFAFSSYWHPGRMLLSHGYTWGRSASTGYEARTKDHLWEARGIAMSRMTMMRVY